MSTTTSSPVSSNSKSWAEFLGFEVTGVFLRRNIRTHLPLITRVLLPPPRRVLEVGTGTGTMSTFVSYLRPVQTVSVDIDADVLKGGKKTASRFHGRVAFARADAFRLPYRDRAFDVAFSQGFFEHFSDAEIAALLREQARVAKRVVFSVPNATYGRRDFGNERLMTRTEWDRILESTGLKLVESSEYAPLRKKFWAQQRVHYVATVRAI